MKDTASWPASGWRVPRSCEARLEPWSRSDRLSGLVAPEPIGATSLARRSLREHRRPIHDHRHRGLAGRLLAHHEQEALSVWCNVEVPTGRSWRRKSAEQAVREQLLRCTELAIAPRLHRYGEQGVAIQVDQLATVATPARRCPTFGRHDLREAISAS